jgi:hypothetical protein
MRRIAAPGSSEVVTIIASEGWASKYIIADPAYHTVLVIGAYAMSKYIDWTEKKTATIFADGAV